MPRPALRAAVVLLLCCLVVEATSKAEKQHKAARKHAASRRERHKGRKSVHADLLTATGGLCHYLETEAFTGQEVPRQSGVEATSALTRPPRLPSRHVFRTLSVTVSLSGSSSSDTESSTGATASNETRSFVASTWDATFFNPGEQKAVFGPTTWPHHYTGYMARQYHNYSIHWTPDYIAWSLDKIVYRNVTRLRHCLRRHCWGIPMVTLIPWRPQTIRIILRTEDGTTLDAQPDSVTLLRRLSYMPLEGTMHAHPEVYVFRQVVFIAIFVFGAFHILRCAVASFAEVEEDLRLAFSGTDPKDGLSNSERRKRMEMTPLLHARVNSQGMLVETSPEGGDPIYRATDSTPASRHVSPLSASPSLRRTSPSDVDSMPLPSSPAAGSTPEKRRRIRGE